MRQLAAIFVTLSIAVIGCAQASSPNPTEPNLAQTPLAATLTPVHANSNTPAPTLTSVAPTPTLVPPTATPLPPSATSTPDPTATPIPKAEDPPQLIKDAQVAMAAQKSYRMRGWIVFQLGKATPVANPTPITNGTPNLNLERSGTRFYSQFGQTETLEIDGHIYERESPTAHWVETTKTNTSQLNQDTFLTDLTKPSGTALEVCGLTICQVVSAEKPGQKAGDPPDKYKVWIGVFDHLVRRTEMTSGNPFASVHAIFEFYDFNVPISIQKPSDVVQEPVVSVGEKATLNGMVLTVTKFIDPVSPGQYSKAKAGYRWVAAEVTIANDGNAPISYNPLYFNLKDDQSKEYSVTFLTSGSQPLSSGDLEPGKSVNGTVTFEIPKTSRASQLLMRASMLTNITITVNLGPKP